MTDSTQTPVIQVPDIELASKCTGVNRVVTVRFPVLRCIGNVHTAKRSIGIVCGMPLTTAVAATVELVVGETLSDLFPRARVRVGVEKWLAAEFLNYPLTRRVSI